MFHSKCRCSIYATEHSLKGFACTGVFPGMFCLAMYLSSQTNPKYIRKQPGSWADFEVESCQMVVSEDGQLGLVASN